MRDLIVNVLADNPSVNQLGEDFLNGNTEAVINKLWRYPPHITALLVLHLLPDHEPQANAVCNLLMDRFMAEREPVLRDMERDSRCDICGGPNH